MIYTTHLSLLDEPFYGWCQNVPIRGGEIVLLFTVENSMLRIYTKLLYFVCLLTVKRQNSFFNGVVEANKKEKNMPSEVSCKLNKASYKIYHVLFRLTTNS